MSKYVFGKNCLFKVNINGDMTPLVCAKNWKINIESGLLDTTTMGSGYWKEYDYHELSYTISFQGTLRMPSLDGMNTPWEVVNAQMSAVPFQFELWFRDDVYNYRVYSGTAIVKSTEFNSAVNQFSGFMLEMQGSGELKLRNTVCDAHIDDVSGIRAVHGASTSTWIVRLKQISPETQYIEYSLNDSARVRLEDYEVGNDTYDFNITTSNAAATTLTIYPYCNLDYWGDVANYTINNNRAGF